MNKIAASKSALLDARRLALEISQRGPISNRLAKQLVRAAADLPLDAALAVGVRAQQTIFGSSDLLHGAESFLKKQEPEFSNK